MQSTVVIVAVSLAACIASPAWAVRKCLDQQRRVFLTDQVCPAGMTDEKLDWLPRSYYEVTTPPNPGRAVADGEKPPPGAADANALHSVFRRWSDAERLALATPRLGLRKPIEAMQAAQRDAEAIEVPRCLDAARGRMVSLMSRATDTMLAFFGARDNAAAAQYVSHDRASASREIEHELLVAQANGCQMGRLKQQGSRVD